MLIDIITIFPEVFKPYINESILKIAQEKGKLKVKLHNLRDYTLDKHRKVDDRPFGGGPGMVMTAEPIFRAAEKIRMTKDEGRGTTKIILLCPQGKTLNQKMARRLSKLKHLILICGRYEGVDERVRRSLADEEISIGDYVLTGGELPAMVLMDALTRLIPGVLGHADSIRDESFSENLRHSKVSNAILCRKGGVGETVPHDWGVLSEADDKSAKRRRGACPHSGIKSEKPILLLEYPQYSRPADFKGMKVPEVLLSGNHKKIEEWRKKQALETTKKKRPDLFREKIKGQ